MRASLRRETAWNLGLAALILLFAVSVALAFVSSGGRLDEAAYRNQLRMHARKAEDADEAAAALRARNLALVWTLDAERIGAASLDNVSKIAKAKGVRLIAFRPQRPVDGGDLEQLPFLMMVDGGYPNAVAFLRALETPSLKLAVNSVQITASDGSSDQVTASIVLVAFRDTGAVVKVDGKAK